MVSKEILLAVSVGLWIVLATFAIFAQGVGLFRPATTLNWIATIVAIGFTGLLIPVFNHVGRTIQEWRIANGE